MNSTDSLDAIIQHCTRTAYPEPDSPIHSCIIPQAVGLFRRFLPPPATVLDIGCGSCFGAKQLRDAGYTVHCVSVLEKEAEHARELGFTADACEMHAITGNFDAVWLRHAAEHSPCPILLLARCAAVADWLYLEVPLPMTSALHETNKNHYSVLTALGWINLLRATNWGIVFEHQWNFLTGTGPDSYLTLICKKSIIAASPPTDSAGA